MHSRTIRARIDWNRVDFYRRAYERFHNTKDRYGRTLKIKVRDEFPDKTYHWSTCSGAKACPDLPTKLVLDFSDRDLAEGATFSWTPPRRGGLPSEVKIYKLGYHPTVNLPNPSVSIVYADPSWDSVTRVNKDYQYTEHVTLSCDVHPLTKDVTTQSVRIDQTWTSSDKPYSKMSWLHIDLDLATKHIRVSEQRGNPFQRWSERFPWLAMFEQRTDTLLYKNPKDETYKKYARVMKEYIRKMPEGTLGKTTIPGLQKETTVNSILEFLHNAGKKSAKKPPAKNPPAKKPPAKKPPAKKPPAKKPPAKKKN
jgi:hypothetical protein